MPIPDVYWRTGLGHHVHVEDMTDSHLTNAIGVTQKFAARRLSHEIVGSVLSPYDIGVAADLINDGFEQFVPPVYYALCAEAKKRELIFGKEPEAPTRPCDLIEFNEWETEED